MPEIIHQIHYSTSANLTISECAILIALGLLAWFTRKDGHLVSYSNVYWRNAFLLDNAGKKQLHKNINCHNGIVAW